MSSPASDPLVPVPKGDTPSFESKYELGALLGQGTFATVYAVKKISSPVNLAVKVFNRSTLNKFEQDAIFSEYEILKSLDHPNIVRVHDFFEDSSEFKIVMESVAGGELLDRIQEKSYYSEKDARDIMGVIISAIKHCHDRNIVHRDLKPENLLMVNDTDDAAIKLADFGFAAVTPGNTLTEFLGTPCYIAPEIYPHRYGPKPAEPYGKPVDMWAVGVILFILLAGYFPFDGEDDELREITIRGEYDLGESCWEVVSDEAKDLVRNLLNVDMNKRFTVEQVLAHAWMAQEDEVLQRHSLAQAITDLRQSISRIRLSEIAGLNYSSDQPPDRCSISSMRYTGIGPPVGAYAAGAAYSAPSYSSSVPLSAAKSGGSTAPVSSAYNFGVAPSVEPTPFSGARIGPPAVVAIPAKFTGYMKKRGRFNTSWQKRFFVLNKGELTYFVGETAKGSKVGQDQRGEVALEGFRVSEVEEAGKTYICLQSGTRKLELKAKTDRSSWVAAFQKHVQYKNATSK